MNGFETLGIPAALRRSIMGALGQRFPQSVLLIGAAGQTRPLGRTIAAALLCEQGNPCGKCNSCRKVEKEIHPDLIEVEEEGDFKVDAARQVRAEAMVLPNDGARKVFLIGHAERMNPAAQNALLKVLEEPPKYCFFILQATQPDRILETILSRCTRYQLPPEEEMPDETLFPLLAPYLRALAKGSEAEIMLAAVGAEKLTRPQMRGWLALLQTALRDAVFASGGLGAPLLPGLAQETSALAAKLPVHRLAAIYDFCAGLSGRVERNAAAAAITCALTADVYTLAYLEEAR